MLVHMNQTVLLKALLYFTIHERLHLGDWHGWAWWELRLGVIDGVLNLIREFFKTTVRWRSVITASQGANIDGGRGLNRWEVLVSHRDHLYSAWVCLVFLRLL